MKCSDAALIFCTHIVLPTQKIDKCLFFFPGELVLLAKSTRMLTLRYLSFKVSVLSVYTRSMCDTWKRGSSLDGSGGIFTRTSFRNSGWKNGCPEKGKVKQTSPTHCSIMKQVVSEHHRETAWHLLFCTSSAVCWSWGWTACLVPRRRTVWRCVWGGGSHWRGKPTVPCCFWSCAADRCGAACEARGS